MKFLTATEAVEDWMTIAPEFRTEAELMKRLACVSQENDYMAWLVEMNEPLGPMYFQLETDNDWTRDHDKALHFARKQDADCVIEYYGWTRAKAIEHMWPRKAT